jgi:tagatose-1,6-bisphosphate aldolase
MNKEGVKVVFVYTPEYIEGQKFIQGRKELISLYSKYSKQYNIPFYDFSNDVICYKKDFFYNSNHLNKDGAELFTRKFVDTLIQSNVFKDLKKG